MKFYILYNWKFEIGFCNSKGLLILANSLFNLFYSDILPDYYLPSLIFITSPLPFMLLSTMTILGFKSIIIDLSSAFSAVCCSRSTCLASITLDFLGQFFACYVSQLLPSFLVFLYVLIPQNSVLKASDILLWLPFNSSNHSPTLWLVWC